MSMAEVMEQITVEYRRELSMSVLNTSVALLLESEGSSSSVELSLRLSFLQRKLDHVDYRIKQEKLHG